MTQVYIIIEVNTVALIYGVSSPKTNVINTGSNTGVLRFEPKVFGDESGLIIEFRYRDIPRIASRGYSCGLICSEQPNEFARPAFAENPTKPGNLSALDT